MAISLLNAGPATVVAEPTDLPYRLVEPGKWKVNGFPDYAMYNSDPPTYSNGVWSIFLDFLEVGNTFELSCVGSENALSLAFPYTDFGGIEGNTGTLVATRPSLPGHLLGRAGNRVVVTGDTTLTLPAAVPGYIRDFLVRLEISGSTVPTITFAAPTGETITYETDGDEFPVPDEAGTWLYSFTESCVAHKFAVALKKVNTVAQGGS